MSARFQDRQERDLFGQSQVSDRKIRKKTKILLPNLKKSMTLSYEHVIFVAIGLTMSCIICFSLGVEKGRRETAGTPNHSLLSGTGQAENRETKTENREPRTENRTTEDNYVIQLAAFKAQGAAEQEREKLRKIGYKADIKRSGDYYQLYVGGFSEKKYAEQLEKKLKETYKDCYVKKGE
ncbi:MAG: SPOR domain-containing protein [Candidatus Omnitrophica bacterium]|nr:SPOR domain-containing protein [Candidatus Omnitrophota bacterium]